MKWLLPVLVVAAAAPCPGAEAVVVVLPAKAAAGTAVITLGQIAKLHGGDPARRTKLAALDIADRAGNDAVVKVTKRQIEIRLKLAGYSEDAVLIGGADTVLIAVARQAIAGADAVAAAKKALLARFPNADELRAELAIPLAVKLPEVAAEDRVSITAEPHAAVAIGRVQMDVTVKVNGQTKLAFPAHFDVNPLRPEPVLVKASQTVAMIVRTGSLNVETVGEAMQDGRRGETIKVRNAASRKIVSGRVTADRTVEIEMGGLP